MKPLVLYLDGTGDWIGDGFTNVAKLYTITDRERQIVYYDGGVGTLSDPGALGPVRRTALRLIDLGTATSIRSKVLQAYTFLVRNYSADAESASPIHLFGFSRGAYVARLVAGMVHNFGLLRPECEHLAPYLWQMYSAIGNIGAFKRAAARIRQNFSRPERVKIAFLGLFDTVSSVGVVGRFRTYPNTDRNPSVLATRHAVSIDEQRNVFPEAPMSSNQPNLVELWFPGVHRDVGGGLEPEHSRIADEALRWMYEEALAIGLRFTGSPPIAAPDARPIRPNLPSFDPYALLGLYPMNIYSKRVRGYRLVWPNFWNLRTLPQEALIAGFSRDFLSQPRERESRPNLPDRPHFVSAIELATDEGSAPERIQRVRFNLSEILTLAFGSAFISLLTHGYVGAPFGGPAPSAWLRWWPAIPIGIVMLELAGHRRWIVLGNQLGLRGRALRQERVLPLVFGGLACLFAAVLIADHRPHLAIALGMGLILGATAQLGSLPVMRANRVLPIVLLWGVALFLATTVARIILPFTADLTAMTAAQRESQLRFVALLIVVPGIWGLVGAAISRWTLSHFTRRSVARKRASLKGAQAPLWLSRKDWTHRLKRLVTTGVTIGIVALTAATDLLVLPNAPSVNVLWTVVGVAYLHIVLWTMGERRLMAQVGVSGSRQHED